MGVNHLFRMLLTYLIFMIALIVVAVIVASDNRKGDDTDDFNY